MKQQTISRVVPIPLPQPSTSDPIDTATLDLIASWRAQDATDNREALHAAEQDIVDFKKSMNENRTNSGEPHLYP